MCVCVCVYIYIYICVRVCVCLEIERKSNKWNFVPFSLLFSGAFWHHFLICCISSKFHTFKHRCLSLSCVSIFKKER